MDPFKEMEKNFRRMNKMFNSFPESGFEGFQRPEIDMMNKENEITVIAELPGVEKENIDLNVQPNSVEIKADTSRGSEKKRKNRYYKERSSKSYKRYIDLPEEVKPGKTEAQYKNGVLEINMPKKHRSEESTNIEIK